MPIKVLQINGRAAAELNTRTIKCLYGEDKEINSVTKHAIYYLCIFN